MNSLSIVIPSYNSGRTIAATLAAIESQSLRSAIREVIVVDSSDDGKTRSVLAPYICDGVRLITPGVRVMPALGRNIGAARATGEILVFIDADTLPAPDWTEKALKAIQTGRLAGGGSIDLPGFQKNRPLPTAQYYLQLNEFMARGHSRKKKFLPSCNIFCEKKLFVRTGGFPHLRSAEDVMFGLKLTRFTPMWFIPEMKAAHIFRDDLKGFLKNQIALGKGNFAYRRRQYPCALCYRNAWPIIFLPGFTMIKLVRIVHRVLKAGSRGTLQFLRIFPLFLLGLLFWAVGFAKGVIENENI